MRIKATLTALAFCFGSLSALAQELPKPANIEPIPQGWYRIGAFKGYAVFPVGAIYKNPGDEVVYKVAPHGCVMLEGKSIWVLRSDVAQPFQILSGNPPTSYLFMVPAAKVHNESAPKTEPAIDCKVPTAP